MHINIGHMIVSSIVHGAVYSVIFKLFRGLGLAGSVILAVAVIVAVWFFAKLYQTRQ